MMWALPRAWTWTPLGPHLVEREEAVGSLAPEEVARFDRLRGVSNREGIIDPPFDRVRPIKDPNRYLVLRVGYFAYNPMRINVGSIGLVRGEAQTGKISPDYVIFTTRRTLLPEYLFAYLKSDVGRQIIRASTGGAVRERLYFRDLARLPIPLPPLPDQRRIVRLLDAAEELRRLRDQADRRTADLIPAIFHQVFGDAEKNPKGWPVFPFRELLAVPLRNGTSPSKAGKVPGAVLTLSAITGAGYDPSCVKEALFAGILEHSSFVTMDDFLICRGNGNLGLVGAARFPSAAIDKVLFPDTMIAARIDPARLERQYLETLWSMPAVRRQLESSARTTNGTYKVNQASIEAINLLLPPLPAQKQFAARVDEARALEAHQAASRRRLDDLFQSLLHRAFRGEL